jgi:DNA-binding LytR/AlgR family response regulator
VSGSWLVLAVDDEPLALDELMHRLRQDDRVGEVIGARDGLEALRLLRGRRFEAVFLDVNMPGLDGVELAAVLAGLAHRPVLVFATAYEQRAAEAYDLDAADYLLKPLRAERVRDALNRVERRIDSDGGAGPAGPGPRDGHDGLASLAIDDGRRTIFVRREDVRFVEAHRDYVHLHAGGPHAGVHVVRMPLAVLEASWRDHGFLRIHRSYLICLRHVSELARDPLGGQIVRIAGHDLPVSRRQAGELRARVQETHRARGTPPRQR